MLPKKFSFLFEVAQTAAAPKESERAKVGEIPPFAADVSHFSVPRRNLCKSPKFTASLSNLA